MVAPRIPLPEDASHPIPHRVTLVAGVPQRIFGANSRRIAIIVNNLFTLDLYFGIQASNDVDAYTFHLPSADTFTMTRVDFGAFICNEWWAISQFGGGQATFTEIVTTK